MTVIRPMSTPGEQRCARGRGPPCSGFAVGGAPSVALGNEPLGRATGLGAF